jgi:recombination protein RecR
MINLPEPIKKFTKNFSKLPQIGPRQSLRLAFHLIRNGKDEIKDYALSISELENVKICKNCFFVHTNKGDLCDICQDKNRHQDIIAIVEKETDLISIENTSRFNGRYLIIGPINHNGILEDYQKKRLEDLKNEITKKFGKAQEIILAFNANRYGEISFNILLKDLSPYAQKITRLARGLPIGGEVEFADEETLGEALKNRN